jgi:hypothetical protein
MLIIDKNLIKYQYFDYQHLVNIYNQTKPLKKLKRN